MTRPARRGPNPEGLKTLPPPTDGPSALRPPASPPRRRTDGDRDEDARDSQQHTWTRTQGKLRSPPSVTHAQHLRARRLPALAAYTVLTTITITVELQ